MSNSRNNNFDILRIIAMLMIIIHHITINDFGLQKYLVSNEMILSNKQTLILIIINSLVVIGVNIFFLLSGYFRINLSLKKIINLIACVYLLYGIITTIGILLGFVPFNNTTIKNLLNPFGLYWFLLAYLLIALLSPILNLVIKKITKKQSISLFIIIILFFVLYPNIDDGVTNINSGYSLIWGLSLYIIGGLINKFKVMNKKGILLYFIFAIINSITIYLLFKGNRFDLAWKQYSYNNILVFLQSISLFIGFNSLKKQIGNHKIISLFASSTLITYLFHSTCWLTILRNYPVKTLIINNCFSIGILILPFYAIIIYFICSIVSLSYDKTIKILINKGIDKYNNLDLRIK